MNGVRVKLPGQFYSDPIHFFELLDTHPNNGGFGCIPGSRKSNLRLPENWRDLSGQVRNASPESRPNRARQSCSPRR